MHVTRSVRWFATVWLAVSSVGLLGQTKTAPPTATSQDPQPTFRVKVDLVTLDVVPRDERGQFAFDLNKGDFQVYEDGVLQEITSITMSYGGRVTNVLAPPPAFAEGLMLPTARHAEDISGRIIIFFVDDLHLEFKNTPRIRELFKQMADTLVHEGDTFGVISSGGSGLAVQMTHDRHRLDDAIAHLAGSELSAEDIVKTPEGNQGPAEIKWRAHVSFSTVHNLLEDLEKVHNRRKVLVYLSDGYDFNPYQDARLGAMDPASPFLENQFSRDINAGMANPNPSPTLNSQTVLQQKQTAQMNDTELARELASLTRDANRANVTMYTVDPRGVVAGVAEVDQTIDPQMMLDFIQKSQTTLRQLADETGGMAVVNKNNLGTALKRIDADSSDYYVLSYYSNNKDVGRRVRHVEVQASRSGQKIQVASRKEYSLKTERVTPTPPAATPPQP